MLSCSCGGPEFSSQHSWLAAHNHLQLKLQRSNALFWLPGLCIHMHICTYIHLVKNKINLKEREGRELGCWCHPIRSRNQERGEHLLEKCPSLRWSWLECTTRADTRAGLKGGNVLAFCRPSQLLIKERNPQLTLYQVGSNVVGTLRFFSESWLGV